MDLKNYQEEIESIFEEMKNYSSTSDEYKKSVDAITRLTEIYLKVKDSDFSQEKANRDEAKDVLKMKFDDRKSKRDMIGKIVPAVIGVLGTAGLMIFVSAVDSEGSFPQKFVGMLSGLIRR